MPVIESSVAEFVERWREHAIPVHLYPQPEGSPLIEAHFAGRVLYLLDRAGPYALRPGETRLIINPVTATVVRADEQEERLHVTGVSRIEATGQVLDVTPSLLVVRALAPLVVGVFDDSWRGVSRGDWVSFTSLEPVHGFPAHT